MGIAALITGILGGLCAVMGGLDAFEVLPDTIDLAVDWTFWLPAAAILLLGSIAFSLGNRPSDD